MYLEKPDDDFLSRNRKIREASGAGPRSTIKQHQQDHGKRKPGTQGAHSASDTMGTRAGRESIKSASTHASERASASERARTCASDIRAKTPHTKKNDLGSGSGANLGSGSGAKTVIVTFVVALALLVTLDFSAHGELSGTSGGKGTQIAAFFDNVATTVSKIGASLTGSGANSADSSVVNVQELENSLKHMELKSDLYIIKNTSDTSYSTLVCLYYHPQANFVKNNLYNFDSYLVVKNGSAYEFDGCYSMPLDCFASLYLGSAASYASDSGSTKSAGSTNFSDANSSEFAIDIIRKNLSNENPYKISVGSIEKDFHINARKNNCVVLTAGNNGIEQLYSGSVAKAFENVVIHEVSYDEMESIVAQWNATYSLTQDSSS